MKGELQWDWRGVHPPTERDHELVADGLADSGVGPDGIPYSCWAASGKSGAETLCGVTDHMRAGYGCGCDFNDVDTVCLGKDSQFIFKAGIVCWPKRTRPIGCKNTDNKICSASVNRKVRWL
eukprot:10153124-Karenia_brevis.AAC.1